MVPIAIVQIVPGSRVRHNSIRTVMRRVLMVKMVWKLTLNGINGSGMTERKTGNWLKVTQKARACTRFHPVVPMKLRVLEADAANLHR